MRTLRSILLATLALATAASIAGAAPAVDDLSVSLNLGRGGMSYAFETRTTPNFQIFVNVDTSVGVRQEITIRTSLPDGLRWGNDAPDSTEGCVSATPVVCTAVVEPNPAGTTGAGWYWDVIADRLGFHEITASVTGYEADPDLSNNTKTFRFEVFQPSTGGGSGGGGGGGGGSVFVSTSTVKLSPAKPKAGSTLVAAVRVTRGGSPVKPTGITCTATVGKTKVKGGAKSSSGLASCLFKTPKAGRGKAMLGTVSFEAGGQSFTKRFSARLR